MNRFLTFYVNTFNLHSTVRKARGSHFTNRDSKILRNERARGHHV